MREPHHTSRREFLAATAAGLLLTRGFQRLAPRPVPTVSQLQWQQDELALFLHFGPNTFTDREWGDGREDPAIFAPTALDAGQWARTAKAAGFRAMILTAKHHDGFCLWPTATTRHSVAGSPFRAGRGDVVREFVDACRAEGLRPGLYLSPWDRNAESYGDSPRYNDFYQDQLTELCTRYGPLAELWFDGANGEGPNGRRQQYDWPRIFGTVRRLQPEAVMFSDAGPDVRWIGNETGSAGDPNWSTVDPEVVPFPGAEGQAVTEMLQHGAPDGRVWRPGETDVSIRPGWFYHPAEDGRVRTGGGLLDLYFTSVGRNSKLLLNVPPDRAGLLSPSDRASLERFRSLRDQLFQEDLTGGRFRWRLTAPGASLVDVDPTQDIGVIELSEEIEAGQMVSGYRIDGLIGSGEWVPLATGKTIGYKKLDRITPTRCRALRLSIDQALGPVRVRLRAFRGVPV